MSEEEIERTELVRVFYTANLDRDRLDEWIAENCPDGADVEIVDRETGEYLAGQKADEEPFLCPECGEGAMSFRHSGGVKVYMHPDGGKCEVGA